MIKKNFWSTKEGAVIDTFEVGIAARVQMGSCSARKDRKIALTPSEVLKLKSGNADFNRKKLISLTTIEDEGYKNG